MIFFNFILWSVKIPRFKKNQGYNGGTVSSTTWKILKCDIESYYKNISKIRNASFIFLNSERNMITSKKFEKIHIDSEKSVNLFKIIKNDRLPDYLLDNY